MPRQARDEGAVVSVQSRTKTLAVARSRVAISLHYVRVYHCVLHNLLLLCIAEHSLPIAMHKSAHTPAVYTAINEIEYFLLKIKEIWREHAWEHVESTRRC